MGYKKIVQYGDTVEIYHYDKPIHRKQPPSWIKHNQLVEGVKPLQSTSVKKKRAKKTLLSSRKKGVYLRSDSSIRRSKINFFRLCHHNNHLADTIHFLTLTFPLDYELNYKKARRHVSDFMARLKKRNGGVPVRYISVPELTKEEQWHFHLLVYDLPSEISGRPISIRRYDKRKEQFEFVQATTERFTRTIQMLFQRGYVDIVPATYTSAGIAGYMAKYMAKALGDSRYEITRGYNCSRGIEKIRSAGGNSLSQFDEYLIPVEGVAESMETVYSVPYLGNCRYKKIKIIK